MTVPTVTWRYHVVACRTHPALIYEYLVFADLAAAVVYDPVAVTLTLVDVAVPDQLPAIIGPHMRWATDDGAPVAWETVRAHLTPRLYFVEDADVETVA